ncbi:hypothetical protein [Vibrio sp. ABG19]|uniref:hypothetical protein n=1 Tax=Vibrio sp. ABG19 TaxID=2817385 RepID=UPI00249E48D4|nr:hypothetical protein [Vibrio sp. ABG19]WGY45513.1 hypothetical protein J0X00_01285 [Vibrio sp. ABG19]
MKRWTAVLLGGYLTLISASVWSEGKSEVINHLPAGLEGMVIIPKAAHGHLLYLHGLGGEGRYLSRNEHGELCMLAPLPMIAGNIRLGTIGIDESGPVILNIYNPVLARQIRHGQQIESRQWRVALPHAKQTADIEIANGLDSEMDFIINPRRRWTSWLRGGEPQPSCKTIASGPTDSTPLR